MAEKDRQKLVQLIADSTRLNSLARVGATHSLTLDLESKEVVIHDGVTKGGAFRIGLGGASGGLATQIAPNAFKISSASSVLSGDGSPGNPLRINLNNLSNADASLIVQAVGCLLYTSPSPRDKRQSRMPSSA